MAPPNNRLMIKVTSTLNKCLYRATGGVIGGRFGKANILLLTTTGRKSGRKRTTPLLYLKDGDDFVLIASNAGDDRNPAWWVNLKAAPHGRVQVGWAKTGVTARQASAEEKARLWPRITDVYPGYDEYTTRTTREIPVVILTPVEHA
jgi:deazaflavin-dependent oxidoreductase (nitroreductase family)